MDSSKQRKSPAAGGRQFGLGVQTYRDRAVLPSGSLSLVSNMRNTYPGIRKRRGMSKLSTADGSTPDWGPIYTSVVRGFSYYQDIAFQASYDTWATLRGSESGITINQVIDTADCQLSSSVQMIKSGVLYDDFGTFRIGRQFFSWDLQPYLSTFPISGGSLRLYFCGSQLSPLDDYGSPTDNTANMCITGMSAYNLYIVNGNLNTASWKAEADTPLTGVYSTAGKGAGTYIDFVLNAAGVSYINGFISGGHYTGYKFLLMLREYDHDVLNVAPTVQDNVWRWQARNNHATQCPSGERPYLYGTGSPCVKRWINGYQYVASREQRNLGGSLGIQYEKKTLIQRRDGVVEVGTDNPPTVTTGQWGSPAFTNAYTVAPLPASFSVLNDILIYSDGVSQHQLWPGPRGRISAAYSNGGTPYQDKGIDIWDNILDSDGRYATLPTIAPSSYEGIIIGTPLAASKITFLLKTISSTAAGSTSIEFLGSNGNWQVPSGVVDGTKVGSDSMKQSGTISWTASANDIGAMYRGQFLHWYRFFPASTGSWTGVELYQAYYGYVSASNSWFQPLENMFNGVYLPAAEARVRTSASDEYTFGGTAVDLSSEDETSKLYVGFSEEPLDINIDLGETPSVVATAVTLTAKYWNGQSLVSLSITDTTNGLKNSGKMIWTPLTINADGTSPWRATTFGAITGEPGQVNVPLFWMEISWDVTTTTKLGDSVIAAFYCQPRKSILPFGNVGVCSAVWKERVCYTFNRFPSYFYVTQNGSVNILNGSDFAVLQAGDGRKNRILSMKRFHNELITWQEEHGDEGGCTTLFEGYSPATFGKINLSSRVGIVNPKASVIVDGAAASTKSTEVFQTKGYWISRYGVFETDGRLVNRISDPIQNYFDPRFTECIRRGYEMEHWIAFDASNYVLRLGLVSGASATLPNIFPVFDILKKEWAFDTYATATKGPVAMFECDTESGAFASLPILLPQGNCWVYLGNQGLNDDSDAIDGAARPEVNYGGQLFNLRESYVRMRFQTGASCALKIYGNGRELTDEARTLPMDADYSGEEFVRHRVIDGAYQVSNASIELRNNVVDKDLYLYDYIVSNEVLEKK